jgi:prolyl-tRNA synthetase
VRMSRLLGTTRRDTPGETDIVGHQLLLRAGFVRQLGQGIFSYLPLGVRSMAKIEAVIREEMEACGGVEVSMPVVQPAEIWHQSGRYETVGPELTRFQDRRQRDLVLAMTHEEVVASLAASEISSYRQLPKLVYQVQMKWRDDPRPRAGLIRAREFTMKDAYSLDADSAGLDLQYRGQYQAYFNIFNRCGLPALAVGSDTGMMGGSLAHEYMYLTPIGEDTLVLCANCGYAQNRQVAAMVKTAPDAEAPAPLQKVATPGTATIAELAAFLDIPAARTAKVVFLMADTGQSSPLPVVAVVRGDMQVNETKLANAIGAGEIRPMTNDEIASIGAVPGYASPIGLKGATVVVDELVAASANLVAGANEAGYHLLNTNWGRDYEPDITTDIVAAEDGDGCVICGHPLHTTRGVEVGNIFKLGTRYAEAFGARYLDAEGQEQPIVMGCYGIGVGRLLACLAEEHHDGRGLTLPVSVAPFNVHICPLGPPGSPAGQAAERAYGALEAAGMEVLLDDREERPGVQFNDADLIGLPVRLTISEKSLARGGIEIKVRTDSEAAIVSEADLVSHVGEVLDRLRRELLAKVVTMPMDSA